MSKSKEKSFQSLVLGSAHHWFANYQRLCSVSGRTSADRSDLYLDILKDLCSDGIPDSVVIHLLAIIEQNASLLDNVDKVEQTLGSLINIYSASTKGDHIRQKYLFTATLLLTYHYEMADSNLSLRQLFDNVIKLLIKCSQKPKTVIGLAAVECLREIGISAPKLLEDAHNAKQIKASQTLILSSLLSNDLISNEDVCGILNELKNLRQLELYHVLTQLFLAIRKQKYQDILSPLIFKPFLSRLTMSGEAYHFHFALQLLYSFGLELFSTSEEEALLKQLVIVANHPSLSVAHRLLALDYAKSIIMKLKPTSIEPSSFAVDKYSDGPDTQEKKLTILNETQIENQNLLSSLKPLEKLSLNGNIRATNAFYRVTYAILTKRQEVLKDFEHILVSIMFASPETHIRRCISLINCYPELSNGTIDKLIDQFKQRDVSFKNVNHLSEFLYAFEWIFQSQYLTLNADQIASILAIVSKNCGRWPQIGSLVLSCCTAVLYHQTIVDSVKTELLPILEWLTNEKKNDISIISLAQIYALALNTLQDDQDIKKVFTGDNEDNNDLEIIKDCTNNSHFTLRRTTRDTHERIADLSVTPYYLDIDFEVILGDQFDRIFAIVLCFDSLERNIHEEIEIPLLDRNVLTVRLRLSSRIDGPFTLNVSTNFNDINGTIFKCDSTHREIVTLQDICMAIDIDEKQFGEMWRSVMTHTESMQTVICLQEYKSVESFMSRFDWLRPLTLTDTDCFACAVTPDRLLFGKIKIVNDFINIFLVTNNYELLSKFYYEFKKS